MSAQEYIERGIHAARLLEDPVLREAFEQVKRDTIAEFTEDLSKAAETHGVLAAVEKLEGRLRAYVNDGEMAKRGD